MENHMGKQIRAHRLRGNMTQEKLAETLHVTAQAVSKWENGTSCPDVSLLPELSATLGVTLDELFETNFGTHLRRIERMLENEPLPAPKFYVNPEVKDFYRFTVDDFRLEGYQYHEFREKIPVAV